ncbi:MAG: T9SS type A sorting domain-containing protein, partial [Bacteroidota bacterium]
AFNYGAAPYLNGDLTLTQARLALLRRSAIHFIDQMVTPTEIHHGDEDFVVTIEHSERIVNTFANAGQVSPDVTYYEYPGEGHNLNMTQAVDRQRLFLCELTNPSVLAVDDVDIAVHCVSQTNVAQIEWHAQVGYHYELECSVDGHDWRVLHFTEVDLPKQSKYRHETGAAEHYLYRLRITDDAQQTRYTKTVTSPCASTRATVFTPNPATHQIRINEPVEQFRIYDTDGKKVLEGQQSTLYVGMLSAGVYQFHYRIGERWFAQKLVLLQ